VTGSLLLRCALNAGSPSAPCLLAVMLSWFATTGCPGATCPVVQHTEPARAMRYHEAMRTHARVLRAEARVDQRGSDGRIRGTVLMFVARPDHVRFDAMTQFGPAAILTSDGRRFALTDLRESRYLEGPTCPENIARLLGIPMSGEDVAKLLFGGSPVIAYATSEVECDDGVYHVVVRARDGRRQELDYEVREQDENAPLEEQRLRLVRSEVFGRNGAREWRATYDDYRVVAADGKGIAMPYEVRFEDARHDADTLVRFEKIDLNVEAPADVFVQRPRPGIAVREVQCD